MLQRLPLLQKLLRMLLQKQVLLQKQMLLQKLMLLLELRLLLKTAKAANIANAAKLLLQNESEELRSKEAVVLAAEQQDYMTSEHVILLRMDGVHALSRQRTRLSNYNSEGPLGHHLHNGVQPLARSRGNGCSFQHVPVLRGMLHVLK